MSQEDEDHLDLISICLFFVCLFVCFYCFYPPIFLEKIRLWGLKLCRALLQFDCAAECLTMYPLDTILIAQ